MEVVIQTLFIGIVATVVIDIWAYLSNKLLKLPRTNWAMVGRWVGHLASGRTSHDLISNSPAIKHELLLGWLFHYLIGVSYAALYVALVFTAMNKIPTLLSAWLFGLVTVLSPWFVLQPALGLGVLASKAAQPHLVRAQNLAIHSIFGIALYYSWLAI